MRHSDLVRSLRKWSGFFVASACKTQVGRRYTPVRLALVIRYRVLRDLRGECLGPIPSEKLPKLPPPTPEKPVAFEETCHLQASPDGIQ
jgi:hypothetical protein